MSEIFKQFKKLFIPIIIGIITAPLLSIFQYKGLIITEPKVISNKQLAYQITCTFDTTYKNIIFTFNVNDTTICTIDNYRMDLSPIPFDRVWVNSSNTRFGYSDISTRSIKISQIKKGQYDLFIPIHFKISENKFVNGVTGGIVLQHYLSGTAVEQFSDFTAYQWYYWFFFHPWLSAIILTIVLVIISLVSPKKKIK